MKTAKREKPAAKQAPPAGAAAALAATTVEPHLNEKQKKSRRNKAALDTLRMRKQLWPELNESKLWLRGDITRKGWTTVPRTISLIVNLIADVSKHVTDGKSVPAGKSYLVLWSRVFDEGLVKIDNEAAAAYEAGYDGQRNTTTWREHLRVLKDLGFIDYKGGLAGPFQYVLLFNPYAVAKDLFEKGWLQQQTYNALYQRALEVGATDLDEFSL